MHGQFTFLGIAAAERRAAQRAAFARLANPEPEDVLAFADACWRQPEREYSCPVTGVV